MGNIWNWILGFFFKAPVILDEIKPVVKEGEDIIVDLSKIVADLKAKNYVSVVFESQTLVKDVQEFVVVLQKVVADLKAKQGN